MRSKRARNEDFLSSECLRLEDGLLVWSVIGGAKIVVQRNRNKRKGISGV